MILRKCLTENPASSAALGMSRNVLFTVHPAVDFICAPPFPGEHLHLAFQRGRKPGSQKLEARSQKGQCREPEGRNPEREGKNQDRRYPFWLLASIPPP